jgi:DNA-binding HxlR family transcriptional regulator
MSEEPGHSDVTSQHQAVQQLAQTHADWTAGQTDAPCPVRAILDRLGDTWTVLVILRLGPGPLRFRELQRAVAGISQRMLTVVLRSAERDGLVQREVFDAVPPAVQYSLTALGYSLAEPLASLARWAIAHDGRMQQARTRFDHRSVPAELPGVRVHRLR